MLGDEEIVEDFMDKQLCNLFSSLGAAITLAERNKY